MLRSPEVVISVFTREQCDCISEHEGVHRLHLTFSLCQHNHNWTLSYDHRTSLKTGYITAYSVMDTIEVASASFFISSIVILVRAREGMGGASFTPGGLVMRGAQTIAERETNEEEIIKG